MPVGRLMLSRTAQLLKELLPSDVTEEGIVTAVNAVFWNALEPIVVSDCRLMLQDASL